MAVANGREFWFSSQRLALWASVDLLFENPGPFGKSDCGHTERGEAPSRRTWSLAEYKESTAI